MTLRFAPEVPSEEGIYGPPFLLLRLGNPQAIALALRRS